DHLADGLERLSPESRRQRFLTAIKRLTTEPLAYLTSPDLEDHLALGIAAQFDDDRPALGIGVVRCVRERPGAETAEVAAAVADDWQGRGVGTLLLSHLARWARAKGIRSFKAAMLADNRAAELLMRTIGPIVNRRTVSRGVIELTADISGD
ncbi:MAG: GNAT family N-acetyltransferase, partial [Deltaproteobacteria bacterium]|nr:GNAT family N-acetyltransferase [Deltaproteobacteria bacterium]